MSQDNLLEERAGALTVTLEQAEQRFHDAMVLLGIAQEELKKRLKDGELPETTDLVAMGSDLSRAWQAFQKERDRVAEVRRKNGELIGGDIDFRTARAAVSEQLGRIAASMAAG